MENKETKEVIKTEAQEPKKKRVSKTWEAILRHQGEVWIKDPAFLI